MHEQALHFAFAPERWTAPGKFLRFDGPPFAVSRQLNDAVRSCADHIDKYETFAALATDLQSGLHLDREELDRDGHTPATRSRQYAAMVEVLICELYSMLDGLRYTLFAIYRRCRGVQQNSTNQLFARAASRGYGADFPDALRVPLAAAYTDWFPELRRLRTAFTHGGLGSCFPSPDSNRITYMNSSLGDSATAHVIPDIVALVNRLANGVFALLRAAFGYLYSRLEPVPSEQSCGVYRNRFYMRKVVPTSDLNRGSGVCASRGWFDAEPDFRCPLANTCEAYHRTTP